MTDTSLDIAKWLGGAAAGALLMYMLDPDRGGARRAQSAAAVKGVGARTSSAVGQAWRGAGERLGAAGERLRGRADGMAADVGARVADGGDATLPPLSRASRDVLDAIDAGRDGTRSAAQRTGDAVERGIDTARDLLGRATDALAGTGAQAGSAMRRFGRDARQAVPDAGAWSPGMRNSALAGGALLAGMGLLRRSPLGLVLGLAGALLLARGAANQPLGEALRGQRSRLSLDQTVDVEKSIHIDAAPEDVYALWTDYENFPRFMSHVREVRDLGRRRSHWVVKGPGGAEFAWNSVLTEQNRPHRLAWRSEPGAEIPQSGSVQFEPHRGGTLVTVRMSYVPPAGVLGHGLAALLGADPQSRMDDDLARMKAFIEHGAQPRDMAPSHAGSRYLH